LQHQIVAIFSRRNLAQCVMRITSRQNNCFMNLQFQFT
jgi:hypothetical protein